MKAIKILGEARPSAISACFKLPIKVMYSTEAEAAEHQDLCHFPYTHFLQPGKPCEMGVIFMPVTCQTFKSSNNKIKNKRQKCSTTLLTFLQASLFCARMVKYPVHTPGDMRCGKNPFLKVLA